MMAVEEDIAVAIVVILIIVVTVSVAHVFEIVVLLDKNCSNSR